MDEQIQSVLCDEDKLLVVCSPGYDDTAEYQLLVRCLSEQTIIENSVRRLRNKKDGGFSSSMLQSPTDPDATYREKAGKKYRGYVANLEESVSENDSVITEYQFEQNTCSDSKFLQDSLQKTEYQEEPSIFNYRWGLLWGRKYSSGGLKNIRLVTTDLTGKDVADIYADFELNKDGNRIIKCPAGYSPVSCCCSGSNGHIHASFSRENCMDCPHKGEYKVKEHKKVCSIGISTTAKYRATTRCYMKTDEFKALARLRNGVETLPSLLRNRYHVDRMSVCGKIRNRFFFGCKVAALNVRKLFTFRNGLGNYAHNPILTQ